MLRAGGDVDYDRGLRTIAALAALVLFVGGCGGDDDGSRMVQPTATPTGVTEATSTPTVPPSSTSTPQATSTLPPTPTATAVPSNTATATETPSPTSTVPPPDELLFVAQSSQLDVYALARDTRDVLIPSRVAEVAGQVCALPDGTGNFLIGESGGQPVWGVFSPSGTKLGELVPAGDPAGEPIGCSFAADGMLFGTTTGDGSGSLVVFFPPDYEESCVLDETLRSPGTIGIDAEGNVYVAEAGPPGRVLRYAPPFPASVADCGAFDAGDTTWIEYADAAVPRGVAQSSDGHWYVASSGDVATIREHDSDGTFVRDLFDPGSGGFPGGLDFDSNGTLYYADLGLQAGSGAGTIRSIHFDAAGNPGAPQVFMDGLTAPEAASVLPPVPEWTTYGGTLQRLFFNADERAIRPDNAARLIPKWRYKTGAIITASPVVASVRVPGQGVVQVVYVTSWDGNLYALRADDGRQVWQYAMKPQPGASYPFAGSASVEWLGERRVVYVAGGMTMYCLDAATGELIWQFDAGTGCTTCGLPFTRDRERNEIESSSAVFDGLVYFGMDINDTGTGKGGMYAVRADDGRLVWYFDLETGATCRPFASDDIRRFDGYHTAEELGLPEDFFATRPGCDFDRSGTQCGNVWSSASIDADRGLLYIASSNCDTDEDPGSLPPPPPMPPYDRALFTLTLDGDPAWVWRPSEVDNDDLSFGAVPNLFEAEIDGVMREVVGIGNKDGTYYLLDRDGVNEINGVSADDPPEIRNEQLPYWKTNVVPGGSIGGIIGSAAVGEGRISFGNGPGLSLDDPQLPAAWSLDLNTGEVVWSNPDAPNTYGPTGAVPGLVFMGSLARTNLNVYAASDGELLARLNTGGFPSGCASLPAVVGGMIFVGTGIGELGGNPDAIQHFTATFDSSISAFCVGDTFGCPDLPLCDDGNPCTYDFREDGECRSEPAPSTLSCSVPVPDGEPQPGSCIDGACVALP